MTDVNRELGLDRPGTYEIKVPGRLNGSWSECFEGMSICVESGEDRPTITTLTGVIADEAALHGVLSRLYSFGLRLLSVRRIEPGLERGGDELEANQGT
jgi:hypothetical protein